jgi:hypothetical protein
VVSCAPERSSELLAVCGRHGVPAAPLGRVGGARLTFGSCSVSLERARAVFETALPGALSVSVDA